MNVENFVKEIVMDFAKIVFQVVLVLPLFASVIYFGVLPLFVKESKESYRW